jgi:hypothetical protein
MLKYLVGYANGTPNRAVFLLTVPWDCEANKSGLHLYN